MSTLEVLKKARSLVASGWTQGAYARTADGRPVSVNYAACWCAYGAVLACAASHGTGDHVVEFLGKFVPCGSIVRYNDRKGTTQADVLAIFDKAIEACEK